MNVKSAENDDFKVKPYVGVLELMKNDTCGRAAEGKPAAGPAVSLSTSSATSSLPLSLVLTLNLFSLPQSSFICVST